MRGQGRLDGSGSAPVHPEGFPAPGRTGAGAIRDTQERDRRIHDHLHGIAGRETVKYVTEIYKYYVAYNRVRRLEAERQAKGSR